MKLTSIIRYYERNTDHSLFFLWHHYFCWCKHFCWWRHQKTVKIRQKLRIWYLANHYSYESDLPLVGKLLDNCIQKMGHKPYFVLIFCWRQHFLGRNIKQFTSCDVIDVTWRHNVGFSQKCQKMFLTLTLTSCENIKSLTLTILKLWTFGSFWV